MRPAPFAYRAADDLEHALDLLSEHGDEAKVLAGGQSLMVLMNFRLARPEVIVDIGRLNELRRLEATASGLRIGALVTHRTIEVGGHPSLAGYELLSRAAREIGHYPIRTRGTFGGSIAHADPTAEWCLLALLLDAQIEVANLRSTRTIEAGDYFQGFFSTSLDATEIVTAVRFPTVPAFASFHECSRRAGDFAIVAAAADVEIREGRCTKARVALGGAGPTPVRASAAESMLKGEIMSRAAIDAAAQTASDEVDPPSDQNGSSSYRRELARVLVRRCLEEVVQRVTDREAPEGRQTWTPAS